MTPDWIALQRTAHHEFTTRLARVTDWDAPTPDSEWSVRDLVAHVVEDEQWVPLLLGGATNAEARLQLEPLGDDLVGEWERHSAASLAAWEQASFDTEVHLSYDTVSADEYLAEQVSDVTIHTWDLARAIGADEELDEALVDAVWGVFEPQADALQASGLYAPAVPVAPDAPLRIRLLALTGRDATA
jgi:uncharacterized protein (TIGR03086 family)